MSIDLHQGCSNILSGGGKRSKKGVEYRDQIRAENSYKCKLSDQNKGKEILLWDENWHLWPSLCRGLVVYLKTCILCDFTSEISC